MNRCVKNETPGNLASAHSASNLSSAEYLDSNKEIRFFTARAFNWQTPQLMMHLLREQPFNFSTDRRKVWTTGIPWKSEVASEKWAI
jgi:hypothetical protein